MSVQVPREASGLRACTRCNLILSTEQLREYSKCPNCKEKISYSKRFKGIVSIVDSNGDDSYIYRLLAARLNMKQLIPGAYAIKVDYMAREENLE